MRLTLRQLHYFIKIVEAGNLTRAAMRLHVAPTALSVQVKAMEERLGVSLLHRHSRGVRPTSAGAELYGKGRQILAMVDEAERMIAPEGAGTNRCFRFGVPPSALHVVGAEAVIAGSTRLDGAVVQLVEGFSSDLIARLHEGELNFVLVSELNRSNSMNVLELLEERMIFATSPQSARDGGKVTLADVLASDLVFYGKQGLCWRTVQKVARATGLQVNVAHQVASHDVIRHLVSRDLGTAILPFGLVEEEMRRGEVAVHVIEDFPIVRRMCLAWLKDDLDTDVESDFISFAVDIVADLHARTAPYSKLLVRKATAPAERVAQTASQKAACLRH